MSGEERISIHESEELFEDRPDYEAPKTFVDYQLSREQINAQPTEAKQAWGGDELFTPRSSDTVRIYPFYPIKPPKNALQPFDVQIKGYDQSMLTIMKRIEAITMIPMMYWRLYNRKDPIEKINSGHLPQVYKLFEPNSELDLVLEERRDIDHYKRVRRRNMELLAAQERKLRLERPWRAINRREEDMFTIDQFNRYISGRDEVEELSELSMGPKEQNKEVAASVRMQAIETLKGTNTSDETINNIRDGIYIFSHQIKTAAIGFVQTADIYSRIYSPSKIGNFIDFHLFHHNYSRYNKIESVRSLVFLKHSIFSSQSTKDIKDRRITFGKKIFSIKYDPVQHREDRFFCSYHLLDSLRDHLFGGECSLTTRGFAYFLCAATGLNYIETEGDESMNSVFREIKRYYPDLVIPKDQEEDEDEEERDEIEDENSNDGYLSENEYSSPDDDASTPSSQSGYCNQQ
ncbi:translational activator, mitochondrial [Acrasis kona]|uniref:Translational activator, mitochondrial n=1 Tax=Acrasis kona TaxID=1008807 RepID=A0AAW2YXE7_9EUKA